ncbi:MAG: hypothetical protein ACM3TU_01670 [Bacillota bacterium]
MLRRVQIEKRVGETPLQAIERWKAKHPSYKDIPATYAGRLDPMASGKLLILLGDECKRKEEYSSLDKTYDIEVLLDVGSDTGDVLGITNPSEICSELTPNRIKEALAAELGTHSHPYPAFSSKPVNGKPLFLHALEGTLDTIEIPVHDETIYRIRYRGSYSLTNDELKTRIASLLALAPSTDEPSKRVGADFRIDQVRESWNEILKTERSYHVLRLSVSCSAGTYMRSLAGRIGEALETKALALSIHRTHIKVPFRFALR